MNVNVVAVLIGWIFSGFMGYFLMCKCKLASGGWCDFVFSIIFGPALCVILVLYIGLSKIKEGLEYLADDFF